ncbi:MAG: hypothetical protein DMF86_22045 [Acidobacteria bacterium]|nr:MAG: hypothetical protein DMF86_22045 [Acidobacteriota bacterium]
MRNGCQPQLVRFPSVRRCRRSAAVHGRARRPRIYLAFSLARGQAYGSTRDRNGGPVGAHITRHVGRCGVHEPTCPRHPLSGEVGVMIAVLIVASIRIYRDGLALMLAREGSFTIAAAVSDRAHAIAYLTDSHPDLVLLDLTTPESDLIIRDVERLSPRAPIVAVGVGDAEQDMLSCVEAGVAGLVSRDASFSPRFEGRLLRRVAALAAARDAAASPERLTVRECEIVRLLEQNLSNKEIAVRLGIEVATVKNHVHNLLEKLHVQRRTDVARRSTRSARAMAGGTPPDPGDPPTF